MATCGKCGKTIEHAHYYNGIAYCMQCAILAENDEAQCASCGMYLPKTEMKMWASRYYCNYCIMDIMDEEERKNKPKKDYYEKKEEKYYQETEKFGKHSSYYDLPKDNKNYPGHSQDFEALKFNDKCDRCGINAEILYVINGKKFCRACMEDYYNTDQHKPDSTVVQLLKKSNEKIKILEKNTKSFFESLYELIFHNKKHKRKPLLEENKYRGRTFDKNSVYKKKK